MIGPSTINGYVIMANNGELIVTIHSDGRVTVNPKYSNEEAALAFWDAVRQLGITGEKPLKCLFCSFIGTKDELIAHSGKCESHPLYAQLAAAKILQTRLDFLAAAAPADSEASHE